MISASVSLIRETTGVDGSAYPPVPEMILTALVRERLFYSHSARKMRLESYWCVDDNKGFSGGIHI